jgi:hypothetical protein
MSARELLRGVLDDARDWAQGRAWWWRVPLLVYLAVAGVRHLASAEYASFLFGGVTFGIHELGHVVFAPFGEWIGIAGGSLAQVLGPIAAGAVLLLWRQDGEPQRDWFGVSVAGCWLAFSLFNLATYVGDARNQDLPLVGLSDDPIHDWHYLLDSVGLLSLDTTLAFLLRVVAFATWATSLAFALWLLRQMQAPRPAPQPGRN